LNAIFLTKVYFSESGKRVFTLVVEGEIFDDLDLVQIGGVYRTAFTIQVAKIVDDGFVSIQAISRVNKAKISGVEIVLKQVHTAHAVSQGPVSRCREAEDIVFICSPIFTIYSQYTIVDKNNDGFGVVIVDACTCKQSLLPTSTRHLLLLICVFSHALSRESYPRSWSCRDRLGLEGGRHSNRDR
jgi:hypothetical protein